MTQIEQQQQAPTAPEQPQQVEVISPTPDKKLSTNERRDIIKRLIERIGVWNINQSDLAREMKVCRHTIYTDIERIKQTTSWKDLDEISFNLAHAYKKALNEVWSELQSDRTQASPMLRLQAAQTLVKVGDSFTAFLEAYGVKKPPQAAQTNVQFNMALVMDQAKQCREDEEKREMEWEAEMARRKKRLAGQTQNSDTPNA